jgi:hypothetical protein
MIWEYCKPADIKLCYQSFDTWLGITRDCSPAFNLDNLPLSPLLLLNRQINEEARSIVKRKI